MTKKTLNFKKKGKKKRIKQIWLSRQTHNMDYENKITPYKAN
jgi:translation initiation factor IF-3